MGARLRPFGLRSLVLLALFLCRACLPALVGRRTHDAVAAATTLQALDALIVLAAASLTLCLLNAVWLDRMVPRHRGAPAPHLLRELVRAGIYGMAAAAVAALVFRRQPTAVWTASGAAGIVLGIALRSIILDLFTAIAFSVELSFRMGDFLEISDRQTAQSYIGRVVGMTWRTTRLEMEDERIVIVPNSRMGELILVNYSQHGGRIRMEAQITLSAATPADRVIRILQAAALATTQTGLILAEPAPHVVVGAVGAQGVEYRVRYWQNINAIRVTAARGLVYASLLRHLSAAGVAPATPQQEVRMVDSIGHFGVEELPRRRMAFLGHIDFLDEALQEAELQSLAQSVVQRRLGAGDVLIEEGAEGDSLFLLGEGLLEVIRSLDGAASRIALIEPGQVVGEMSLLTGERRSATVRALSDSIVHEVGAPALKGLLQARPEIAESLSRLAARRAAGPGPRPAGDDRPRDPKAMALLHRIRRFFGLDTA